MKKDIVKNFLKTTKPQYVTMYINYTNGESIVYGSLQFINTDLIDCRNAKITLIDNLLNNQVTL